MSQETAGKFYGMISKGGKLVRPSHNSFEGRLANTAHYQYLDGNTKIFNDYDIEIYNNFICRNDSTDTEIAILSIDSQDVSQITFLLSKTPDTTCSIFFKDDLGYKWKYITPSGNTVTIDANNQELIIANNTMYVDDDSVNHTNPYLVDINSATNKAFDRIKNATDVIGMVDEDTKTMDYTSNNILVDDESLKQGLEKIDSQIGDRLYDYEDVLTDGQTITDSFKAIDGFIHQEYYTEEFGYQAYQDIAKQVGVNVYSLTQDENATTPEVIVDFTNVINDVDLFSVTDVDFKPIYKQGSVFKTASNLVKVTSYNSTTGEITLNFEPKSDFRVNYTIMYNRKTVPEGKLQLASNIQNVIERDENEEEDSIQFETGKVNPSHNEGLLFYDNNKKALSYYNENDEVTVNLSREVLIRVINNSGDDIPNGAVVYPEGVLSDLPDIRLATATNERKSKVVGVVTNTILNGEIGYVTKFGEVSDLDTSSFSVGDVVYLSDNEGEITNVKPSGGSFVTTIGVVEVVNATTGRIIVDIIASQLAVEVTDTNGLPHDRSLGSTLDLQTGTAMEFNDVTREFYIEPIGTTFRFYEQGVQYLKDSRQSLILDDVEGLHIIYFKDGVLTTELFTSPAQVEPVILKHCIVSYIYWDATNKKSVYFGEERHGISMSPETHVYLHQTRGCQYVSGLGIGDIISNGNGDIDTHAQFSISGGSIRDEDIVNVIQGVDSITGLPIYYLEGAELKRYSLNSGFSVTNTGTGRLAYNENIAGNWQISEVNNNDFVLYHIFAVSNYKEQFKLVSVMGQNQYPNLGTARAGASSEISNLISTLLTAETTPIATIIYQTSNSYANTVKARIVKTDTGDDYIDWRSTELAMGSTASSHNNLANLQLSGEGVTWGHINDQLQVIKGLKVLEDGIHIVSTTNTFNIESKTLDTFLYSLYKSAIYDYEISNGSNMRVGTVKVLSNGITANNSDNSEVEFGNTSSVSFTATYETGNVNLNVISTTTGWTIKFKKKYM